MVLGSSSSGLTDPAPTKARFPLAKASRQGKACSKTEHFSGVAKEGGKGRGMPGVRSCPKKGQAWPSQEQKGLAYRVMAVRVMVRLDGGWSPPKCLC